MNDKIYFEFPPRRPTTPSRRGWWVSSDNSKLPVSEHLLQPLTAGYPRCLENIVYIRHLHCPCLVNIVYTFTLSLLITEE